MFCTSCGKENKNGAKFCAKCGKDLSQGVETTVETVEQTQIVGTSNPVPNTQETVANPVPNKKIGKNISFVIGGIVAVAAVACYFLFFSSGAGAIAGEWTVSDAQIGQYDFLEYVDMSADTAVIKIAGNGKVEATIRNEYDPSEYIKISNITIKKGKEGYYLDDIWKFTFETNSEDIKEVLEQVERYNVIQKTKSGEYQLSQTGVESIETLLKAQMGIDVDIKSLVEAHKKEIVLVKDGGKLEIRSPYIRNAAISLTKK